VLPARQVNTLLDFSRIEAGRVQAVYKPTDLAAFTAELASVFCSAIEKAGLRLVVDCPPLPEPVFVDRDMWEKIVLNLMSNAFKFTFEGKEKGCRFALDDFGSGLSSFAYLKNLPVDYLKIDGSFIKDMATDSINYAMVEAIRRVGYLMGLKTIAESVENDAILEKLKAIGVDYAQGYGIAKPRPLGDIGGL
jgi:hypothetical protein